MEEAELAAHANTWIPSEPLNQDMDSQLRYLLVMLTSGPALLIIRQQPSGVQAFRDLARRYNPRSQARSWAQLQEIMHLDFGQEPAGVTDRTIVFERLVGENETSSGEALGVQVKKRRASGESSARTQDTPVAHLWFTTGLRHHETDSGKLLSGETVMAARPFNDNGRSANGNRRCVRRQRQERQTRQGQERQEQGKGKHNGEHESSPKVEGYCGHCGSGDTRRKTVGTRTLLPKWRRSLSNLQTAVRAAARLLLVCLQLELRSPRRGRSPR